jgi:uncharacterized protein (TIGR02466 family)|tara:strand:+ start:454 stop:1125 length:672 start_codon:yes stop_codon:yes gene_type:complete
MSDKKGEIQVQTYNWGPCVIRLKMRDEFKKLLTDEAKKNKLDFKNKLAGIIEKETGYSEESKAKIVPLLSQYLGVYDQMFERFVCKPYDKKPEYVLSALWINYQKANEYNPPHDHDGKLSFVAYLQIPDELKKENSEYVGRSCGPGGIQFIYGNGPRDCVTYQSFFPEEGDMYIFPAWLKHWVAPYKSDCTRISVSGNIHDSAPLNTIQRFAPEYLKDRDEKK